MAVWQLNEDLWFPDPHTGEDDDCGTLAVGGDLSVDRLVLAYSHGIFPFYAFRDSKEPQWCCPMTRFVIFPSEIKVSHSMRQLIRQKRYEVTANQDFEGVIRGCSKAQGRIDEHYAWLGPDMIKAYVALHRAGYAASVEVWEPVQKEGPDGTSHRSRRLVGGLYGVTVRNAFFGESMFSLVPSASKLALIVLAKGLESVGAHFIDCQYHTGHLESMGGRHISYEEYMALLNS